MGIIVGLLSGTCTHFLGTLAMTNWFLMLKKGLNNTTSYILFYRKVLMFPRIYQKKKFDSFFFLFWKGVLSFQALSLGPTYNPSPERELSLLTQFSGFITLQSLVSEKHCKGAWPSMVLSMRSDNLTYNPSPWNS